MATVHFGSMPFVVLFRPEHVCYVLTENPRNFTSAEFNLELRELIGDGLLTLDGEAHRQQRRLAQPAFHKKRVESYAGIMVQHTREMLKDWHAGERIDVASAMQQLTMRIVAQCLFNVNLANQVDSLGRAFTAMINNPITLTEGFLRLRLDLPITSYGRRMAAKRIVDAFIYDLVARRRADGGDAGDVLSMLLAARDEDGALTDTQVHDHILTFFAAGHETTANALTWTFHLLSQYPAEREKLLAELQTVLAGRAPTVDDLPHLPYTEWVLNESMRLYPPAWLLGRRAIEAFDLDGIHFPAGTMVMFSQWVIHRLPDIWSDPEVFQPERWDPSRRGRFTAPTADSSAPVAGVSAQNSSSTPWSYFPFGGGPRICIGMPFAQLEARLLLATILQHYLPFTAPGFRAEPDPLITLRPKNGLQSILMSTTANTEGSGRLLLQLPDMQQRRSQRKGRGRVIGD